MKSNSVSNAPVQKMGKDLQAELRKLGVKDPEKDPFEGLPLNRLGRPMVFGRWLARGRIPKNWTHRCAQCGWLAREEQLDELSTEVRISRILVGAGLSGGAKVCQRCKPLR